MTLRLRPYQPAGEPTPLPEHYQILSGEVAVGGLQRLHGAPTERWTWSFTVLMMVDKPGYLHGGADTREEAMADARAAWDRWLARARLREDDDGA